VLSTRGMGIEYRASMLATAIVALVLSVASLSWQVVSWSRAGPKVVVQATPGITIGSLGNENFIAIIVTNEGRAAATIGSVGFMTPTGQQLVSMGSYIIPVELAKRLEPGGDQFQYWYDPKRLQDQCQNNGHKVGGLIPFACQGTRKIVGTWSGLPSA
jgi:hypothetical protein